MSKNRYEKYKSRELTEEELAQRDRIFEKLKGRERIKGTFDDWEWEYYISNKEDNEQSNREA